VRGHFRQNVAIHDKADETPVTIADREAEAAMRAILTEACPDHGVIGEEYGTEREDAEYVWILDPIDGTKSFVTGSPLFGTLIALMRSGEPMLGVINMPMLGERWTGVAGEGVVFQARRDASAALCRECPSLDEAYLRTTSPEMFETEGLTAQWDRLRKAVKQPVYGGDCYNYGLLASGHIDLVVEANLQTYDYMALIPIVEGAGGVASDWRGRPLTVASDGRVVMAGDARVHAQALALLQPS
jgi:inositol-phosphate phosphatase/L-galactose 1-phosphate phosphatase/histidinol-phosphatase